MNKASKITTLILITCLAVMGLIAPAKSSVPLLPMTVYGYVTIHRIDGTNITAPEGLYVYAKDNTTIINAMGTWTTDTNGYYSIGCSATTEGKLIDIWVQNLNVTRVVFHSGTFLELNLTVIDTTAPEIQPLSPKPGETVSLNQPVWINATLTDNLAINTTTIKMTLNETQLDAIYNSATGLLYKQTNITDEGLYFASVYAEDIAGNNATKTWNFTAISAAPPVIAILDPTTASPVYTQSGKTIEITVNYTELNPFNRTIKVYDTAGTLVEMSNTTAITPGTNVTQTVEFEIPASAPEGKYDLGVTLSNIYSLSTTATQTSAVIIDNSAPIIGNPYQEPPGQTAQPGATIEIQLGSNVTVRVNVTDEIGLVKQVILSYNITATQWENIEMQKTTGDQYSATIPSSQLAVGTTIRYYITAYDNADNMAKSPTSDVYFQYQVIPEFSTPTLLTILMLFTATVLTLLRRKRSNP